MHNICTTLQIKHSLSPLLTDVEPVSYTHLTGYSVKFDGFTVLYEEAKDDEGEKKNVLPPIKSGDSIKVRNLEGNRCV